MAALTTVKILTSPEYRKEMEAKERMKCEKKLQEKEKREKKRAER